MGADLEDCRLYTFVDTAYLAGRSVAEVARQLCDGGSDIIQLRAKGLTADQIRRLGEEVLAVTKAAGVPLVINDYPEIVTELGAEAGHLGQEDFFDHGFTHRNQIFGPGSKTILGLSSHAPDQAERAIKAGADYVAIGPVHATGTKPGRQPVTLDYVRWAAAYIQIPWFAIGGINLSNLDAVLAAGATRICVVSAILNAPGIASACANFRRRLDAH